MNPIFKFSCSWLFALFLALGLTATSCTEEEPELYGNVHGYVSDEATGEPIRTASVTINPGGKKTVTGSDGRFEYTTLEAGQYTLQIAKDGYQTNVGNVTVVPGQTAQCDILLRPGDGYLKVNKSEINLGTSNNMAAFEISNSGKIELQWTIKKDCDWISEITPSAGNTAPGKRSSVTVKIDRSKLEKGKNYSYSIIITSNAGAADVTILASGGGNGEDPDDPDNPNQPGSGENIVAGLMAYYTFDSENADDATDNQIDGTLMNNPTFVDNTPNGKGKALFINGTKEQFVNIPYNPFKAKTSFSISLWLKDFGAGVIFNAVCSSSKYKNAPGLLTNPDGKFEFTTGGEDFYLGKYYPFSYPYKSLQDNQWHMITLISTSKKDYGCIKQLYINGKLIDTTDGNFRAGSDNIEATKIQIGGDGEGVYENLTFGSFKIDNIRFYDRALSNQEIKAIYDYEKAQ